MLCYVYDGFGQEDWFLPSLDEAVVISENTYDFRSWTSSEYDGLKAYLVESNYPPLAEFKSYGQYVRPTYARSQFSESWYGASCLTEITYGCTDNNACNFSALANINNQTCTYRVDGFDCSGTCLNDADGDGVCDEDEVVGCTDESACNYSSLATDDDGMCSFVDACGICGGDGTTCEAECSNQEDEVAALGGCANAVFLLGCETLWNGTPLNEICPESCQSCPCESDFNKNGVCDEDEVFDAFTQPLATTMRSLQPMMVPVGIHLPDTIATARAFTSVAWMNRVATLRLGPQRMIPCTFACIPFQVTTCTGECVNDADNDGFCDEDEIAGCTDGTACNYEAEATDDDVQLHIC